MVLSSTIFGFIAVSICLQQQPKAVGAHWVSQPLCTCCVLQSTEMPSPPPLGMQATVHEVPSVREKRTFQMAYNINGGQGGYAPCHRLRLCHFQHSVSYDAKRTAFLLILPHPVSTASIYLAPHCYNKNVYCIVYGRHMGHIHETGPVTATA